MKAHRWFALCFLVWMAGARAEVCNLRVVTDASPDYTDLPSMVRSITARWPTPKEKCWAVWYWNHFARRQVPPMVLHGMAVTDPIRQFNDYGYMMCSTIAGANCAIWHQMGLPVRYWDVTLHTVPEVFYDGRWHMYDNSLSAIYTLCDGTTIAGVEDIGREGACAASGGKREPGHIARYHCLTATSPNGFLTGSDTLRSLDDEYRCFNPNGLKLRTYYNDWDFGHRYILNLKEGESYTRYYARRGNTREFYVPNEGRDPAAGIEHLGISGNGEWHFEADLSPARWRRVVHSAVNVAAVAPSGLQPAKPNAPAQVIYKVQGANVITSQRIEAGFLLTGARDAARIAISTHNGLRWTEVWQSAAPGRQQAVVPLVDQVNGAYEVLIRITLSGAARLTRLQIQTVTQLNAKTQPRLNLGRNIVYVGAGDPTESVVFWPELQGGRYREHIVAEKNIACVEKHIGYQGAIYPARANEDAYLIYRMDAPRDITQVTFGGRFYNRAPGSRIDLLYSLDGGKRWQPCWSLTSTEQPWDVIHYETVRVPSGHRSVWLKYQMKTPDPAPSGCSIYAVRLEANYPPADAAFRPITITFRWSERQADRSLVPRSHTQVVTRLPFRYVINVGGADHPVVHSLRIAAAGAAPDAKPGYSDGKDVGGAKWVGRWLTCGRNLAIGKRYTLSVPSDTAWEAGDPDGTKLTDGVVGPSFAGGTSYRTGAIWPPNTNPIVTLDLETPVQCASFGMNFHGYEWWDAMKGEVKDRVEVLTSIDGKEFESQGFLHTDLRWQEIPVNFMMPDNEALTGATFRLVPQKPVRARFVQYRVTSSRYFCCTELEVLDSIRYEPFDLRLALPSGG